MTVRELAEILAPFPQDLDVYLTNGDLPAVPAASAAVQAAGYGQLVLISR